MAKNNGEIGEKIDSENGENGEKIDGDNSEIFSAILPWRKSRKMVNGNYQF